MSLRLLLGLGLIGAAAFYARDSFAADPAGAGEGDTGSVDLPATDTIQSTTDTADTGYSSQVSGILDQLGATMKNLFTLPGSADPYKEAIASAEVAQGLPQGMLGRLLYQESHYRQDIITGKTKSAVGALGIAQFMPATAAQLGINPLDPFQAIPAAAKYLRQLYDQTGSWDKALASYNWGIGNVKKKGLANAPAETKNYFTSILADIGLA
jgi:hypothetical protein